MIREWVAHSPCGLTRLGAYTSKGRMLDDMWPRLSPGAVFIAYHAPSQERTRYLRMWYGWWRL